MRPLASLAFLVLLLATPALAGDGVQILPDGSQILVSKDVGSERWSIGMDLGEDHPLNLTGNVFRSDGGAPAFVWCSLTDVNGSADDIRNAVFSWACYASDRCPAPPCGADDWSFVSSVSLPGRFFLP